MGKFQHKFSHYFFVFFIPSCDSSELVIDNCNPDGTLENMLKVSQTERSGMSYVVLSNGKYQLTHESSSNSYNDTPQKMLVVSYNIVNHRQPSSQNYSILNENPLIKESKLVLSDLNTKGLEAFLERYPDLHELKYVGILLNKFYPQNILISSVLEGDDKQLG